jgi:hypothetical protein
MHRERMRAETTGKGDNTTDNSDATDHTSPASSDKAQADLDPWGTWTPGLIPFSAVLTMDPGWKCPDPATTSFHLLSDERVLETNQSTVDDSDQT